MNPKHLLLLFLFLTLAACRERPSDVIVEPGSATRPAPTPAATSAVSAAPSAASAATTILADGQLVAVTPVLALGFEAGGRLLAVAVRPGDRVAAGDVIATLDDAGLQDAVTSAELQLAQAENSLAQAQLSLDNLLNWEPDATAVALAEANLTAAEVALANAEAADAAAGNSLTSARVNLDQAQRALADAQEAYDTAFDPGREWELGDPFRSRALEAEREGATRSLEFAQENLRVAQAQYNLAVAGLNNDTAVSANAGLLSAQQALAQATTGPRESEISAARLQVAQAELALAQSEFSLQQAQAALAKAALRAPWAGTVLSVDVAAGATIGAGTPVVTLLDTDQIQFHTSNLSERDLAQVQPGQPVSLILKSYPSQTLTGTVAAIAPQAGGMVGDAAVFTVRINLDATELTLRPGMTGRAEIRGE
ncbi:MAG: HlyD family efflux transporter periplasmic adaptor subunit [Anaerolineales bacterium]|nr:HlyD family efflux transporter periplasmic adaptor subunit [Anaerolineales bacterium]